MNLRACHVVVNHSLHASKPHFKQSMGVVAMARMNKSYVVYESFKLVSRILSIYVVPSNTS